MYSGFVDFVFLKCTVYIYIYVWHYSLYAIFCILNMIFIYCMYIITIDWLDDDFCLFCRFAWWKFSCDWTKRCIKCVQIFHSGSWEPIHCGTAGHIVIVIFRSSSSGHITETASWSPQMVVIFGNPSQDAPYADLGIIVICPASSAPSTFDIRRKKHINRMFLKPGRRNGWTFRRISR